MHHPLRTCLFVLFLLASCAQGQLDGPAGVGDGDAGAESPCVAGATQACLCVGGGGGLQWCEAGGSRWSSCDCESESSDGAVPDRDEDAGVSLVHPDASSAGEACRRHADCLDGLFCVGGDCGPQCRDDGDCGPAEHCVESRCELLDPNGPPLRRYDDFDPKPDPRASGSYGSWDKPCVSWNLASHPPGLSTADALDAVREAFATWGEHAGLTFLESDASADIRLSLRPAGQHGDQCAFGPETLAHAFYPRQARPICEFGEIHFNAGLSWSAAPANNPSDPIDYRTIAIHEIGHALGLHHSAAPGSVMSATYPGTRHRLDGGDIDAVRSLYPGNPLGCECEAGEVQVCGRSIGACRPGTTSCVDGQWGPCRDQTEPTSEQCDDLDNDCDGSTDEDGVCGVCDLLPNGEIVDYGAWGDCGQFSDQCDEEGTRVRLNQVCRFGETVFEEEAQDCRRNTGGDLLSRGNWGQCEGFSGPCDESGTRSRTNQVCGDGRQRAEQESDPCERDTDGDGCGNAGNCRNAVCIEGETCDEGAIRLVGGANRNEGRVEICHINQWGTVCDDFWGDRSARVVCRQLGLPTGGATGRNNAAFGPGQDPIWLDDVRCLGDEANLSACPHDPWGEHNCEHGEDAGVVCAEAAPAECPGGDGLYCGESVGRQAGTLYRCTDGAYQVEQACANGCEARPAGQNDRCAAAPAGCPAGNGLYCGESVGRQAGTLYRCTDGAYQVEQACANGCEARPAGQNDRCAAGGGGPVDPEAVDGFDYPVGSPIRAGGDGFVSEARDGDGYYNAQDFTVNRHCGEDWNGDGGGHSDFGDPVYASANGVVVFAGPAGQGWGDVILIQHDIPGAGNVSYQIIQTQYAHLSRMDVGVGEFVLRGMKVGEIGTADGAWPAHLHFEMRWDEDQPPGGSGYDCPNDNTGMTDPSDFIDGHRNWP